MTAMPRRFHLQRHHDITGVSGTGTVAVGVLWPDRTASVRWLGTRPSTVHWDCIEDAIAVHGHGGATEIVWDDEPTAHRHRAKGTNAEDCPACTGTNPPYPFLCPGPDDEQPAVPAQREEQMPAASRYRQRPLQADAIQWTGSNAEALRAFAGQHFDTIDPEDRIEDPDQDAQLLAEASHWVGIRPGDWVLKFEGYFIAKSDEAFRAVWEPAPC